MELWDRVGAAEEPHLHVDRLGATPFSIRQHQQRCPAMSFPCHAMPCCAVLCTQLVGVLGELASPGQPLPGYARMLLTCLLRALRADPVPLGKLGKDLARLANTFQVSGW